MFSELQCTGCIWDFLLLVSSEAADFDCGFIGKDVLSYMLYIMLGMYFVIG